MYTSGKVLGASTAGIGAIALLPQTSGNSIVSITILLLLFLITWAFAYLLIEYIVKKLLAKKR